MWKEDLIGELVLVEKHQPYRNKFLCEFFCWSQGLNARLLTQCKGEGKERSLYHLTPLVWLLLTSGWIKGPVAAAISSISYLITMTPKRVHPFE